MKCQIIFLETMNEMSRQFSGKGNNILKCPQLNFKSFMLMIK